MGILNETLGVGLTPPNCSTTAALSSLLDLSEGSSLFMSIREPGFEATYMQYALSQSRAQLHPLNIFIGGAGKSMNRV